MWADIAFCSSFRDSYCGCRLSVGFLQDLGFIYVLCTRRYQSIVAQSEYKNNAVFLQCLHPSPYNTMHSHSLPIRIHILYTRPLISSFPFATARLHQFARIIDKERSYTDTLAIQSSQINYHPFTPSPPTRIMARENTGTYTCITQRPRLPST